MFTGRPAGSKAPLGTEMTPEERKRIRASFKGVKFADVMEFMEALPRDMIFAVRVSNLVRGIYVDLGGNNKERFEINAAYAVKGCWCLPVAEREIDIRQRVEVIESIAREKGLYGARGVDLSHAAATTSASSSSSSSSIEQWVKLHKKLGYDGLYLWKPSTWLYDIRGLSAQFGFVKDLMWLNTRLWTFGRVFDIFRFWKWFSKSEGPSAVESLTSSEKDHGKDSSKDADGSK
jgi:hypothetical protein